MTDSNITEPSGPVGSTGYVKYDTDDDIVDPAPVTGQTTFQVWGTGIFSLLFSLLTAFTTINFVGGNFANSLQVIPLVVTGLVTWIIPLGKGRWPGIWKTGLDLLSIIAVVLFPVVVNTTWPWPPLTWILIGLAVLKASATELGINVRTSTERALTVGS